MSQTAQVWLVLLLLAVAVSGCSVPQPQRCSGALEPINVPDEPDRKPRDSHER